MPGYVKKKLQEYKHTLPARMQACPYSPEPKTYGEKAQVPLPTDGSPPSTRPVLKRSNKLSAAYSTTPEPWI